MTRTARVAREGDVPGESLLATWRTCDRAMAFLVEQLPDAVWPEPVPGAPNRTPRMLAAHVHNARCMWLRSLTEGLAIRVPRRVDPRRVTRVQLLGALRRSGVAMGRLLERCLANRGRLPVRPGWLNLPDDVAHVLAYFVAHEAHHRGQLVLVARQLGHRLPVRITGGVWQWRRFAREAAPARRG